MYVLAISAVFAVRWWWWWWW